MATTTKIKPDEKKKKKQKNLSAGAALPVKGKVKKDKGAKAGKDERAKAGKKGEGKARKHDGFDGLAKLVDHPLVADLLAAGAIAAVAAIAEHKMGNSESSSKMIKSVGKAAAAAMGKRLMGDLGAVTGAAVDAAKKA
ncbi:MAG TPA: hypothetical protein VFT07_07170 [Sphingomicrobium sp.]|jgi:hypothetical protein|nr:hypothetical protein [Sphingomicrobium sp.]